MRRFLILVLLVAMGALSTMAQTSFYTSQATGNINILGSPNQVLGPIPYGSVRVCGLPLTQASPCLPLATITDVNGNAISNAIGANFGQLTTDATGRFTFGCSVNNNYQIQVTQSASNTPALNYPITCPGTGANPTFTNLTVSGSFNNIQWAGPGATPTISTAESNCGVGPCTIMISSSYSGAESANLVTVDGQTRYAGQDNITIVDLRSGTEHNYGVNYAGTVLGSLPRMAVTQTKTSPTATTSALLANNFVTGSPSSIGTIAGMTAQVSIFGTATPFASSHVTGIEGYAEVVPTSVQTWPTVYGITGSVNIDRTTGKGNITDAIGVHGGSGQNISTSGATVTNAYAVVGDQPTYGTARNYAIYANGWLLMPNNVNFDVVNSSGTPGHFITFSLDNSTQFRPRGTDQAGEFGFTDTTATIPIMTLGTSGGAVLAGVCKQGPAFRWHVECATAGDAIAKFKNTSGTGFGVKFVPGADANYAIAVLNAAETVLNFTVTGAGVATLGTSGTNAGQLNLAGATSGTSTLNPPTTGGVSNTLPSTAGTLAVVLTATSAAFATATTAGTCVQNTTSVTNATTSMVATASPVSTPGVGAVWSAFVSSAGNVTINECAVAASAGGSIAFNIRVTP